jgi:peptide/nickel transport system permease protein
MLRYIIRRLLAAVPMLLVITFLNFALIRLAPGDPMTFMMIGNIDAATGGQEMHTFLGMSKGEGDERTEENLSFMEAKRRELGLDQPIIVQYGRWLGNLVLHGDFGLSMQTYIPINSEMGTRIGVTLRLTLFSLLISVILGIAVGTVCGIYPNSGFDRVVSLFTYTMVSIPGFLYATMFVLVFAMLLNWFPTGGMYNPRGGGGLGDRIYHLILPLVTMGTYGSAGIIRFVRASVRNVMQSDFVTVARAKGLGEQVIRTRHILRNALLPVLTIVGARLPTLIGGSALFERVFVFPGLGLWAANAAAAKDFSVMIAVVTVTSTIMVIGNVVVDISYAAVDPRIRYS